MCYIQARIGTHIPEASKHPEGRCQMSALPKREWSMTPSGDWSLRMTKLGGTAYDWSHCLVAPVQTAANQQLPPGDRSRLRPVIDFWLPTSQLVGRGRLQVLTRSKFPIIQTLVLLI